MTTFRQAGIAIVWVAFFHVLGMIALYSWYPYYDVPMHFAGGVAMGVLALALWDYLGVTLTFRVKKPWVKRVFMAFCIIGFVGLVGIGWEWFEFLFDQFVQARLSWGIAQTSVADTMADLFFDVLGALAVVLWRNV